MASTRSIGGSVVVAQRRVKLGVSLAPLFLALCAFIPLRAFGATLPPGAEPCFTNAVPADHGTFRLLKSADFVQSSAATPTGGQGIADIRLTPPPGFGITNASVSGPAGFLANLTPQPGGSSTWSAEDTEAALMARMPAGAWSAFLQIVDPSGAGFVGILPFTLASNLPPVPTVLNFDAAQNVDPAAPFDFSWNVWPGVTAADRLSLQVVDASGRTVFASASDCSAALGIPVTATSVTAPAGTFAAGTSYTAYLTFGASLLNATDAGFVERAFQSRTTRFSVRTRGGGGGPATPGQFLPPAIVGTNLVFTLTGAVGSRHVIESSTDFAAWRDEVEVVIPAAGQVQATIPIVPGSPPRFYRARALGGAPPAGEPAQLRLALLSPTQVQLTVVGSGGSTYAIESTPNYSQWTQVTNVTIPAGSTTALVTLAVTPGAPLIVFRASTTGSTPPPAGRQPTLALSISGTNARLTLTGGDPQRSYAFEGASSTWSSWSSTTFNIVTDVEGNGATTIPIATGQTAVFLRAVAQ